MTMNTTKIYTIEQVNHMRAPAMLEVGALYCLTPARKNFNNVRVLSLPDIWGEVCCTVEDTFAGNGKVLNLLEPLADFREIPLGWVEGKPVYKGDTLYGRVSGDAYTASGEPFPREFLSPRGKQTDFGWVTWNNHPERTYVVVGADETVQENVGEVWIHGMRKFSRRDAAAEYARTARPGYTYRVMELIDV